MQDGQAAPMVFLWTVRPDVLQESNPRFLHQVLRRYGMHAAPSHEALDIFSKHGFIAGQDFLFSLAGHKKYAPFFSEQAYYQASSMPRYLFFLVFIASNKGVGVCHSIQLSYGRIQDLLYPSKPYLSRLFGDRVFCGCSRIQKHL